MKIFYQYGLGLLLILFALSACGEKSEPADKKTPEKSAEMSMPDKKNNPEMKKMEMEPVPASEVKKSAMLYTETLCMVIDPDFWKGLFKGVFNSSGKKNPMSDAAKKELADKKVDKKAEAKRKAEAKKMLARYGYKNFNEAKVEMKKYWGSPEFKNAVKMYAKNKCGAAVEKHKVDLDKILDAPLKKEKQAPKKTEMMQ